MIPHVYSNVLPQDFTLTGVKVHKKFVIQRSQLYTGSNPVTSSGYKVLEARYPTGILKLGTDSQPLYETNSFDGSYKNIIWKSIDSQYYRYPYDSYKTLEHANPRFTYKFLNYSASVISVPYLDYGESIKPGSVEFTGSGFMLRDDGNGNLYNPSINTGSFAPNYNLVAYWNFDTLFNKVKDFRPTQDFSAGFIPINECDVEYKSNTFQPNEKTILKNCYLETGVTLNSTASGLSIYCASNASILTDNRDEFNFTKESDFTIGFWIKASIFDQSEQYDYTQIISKRGTVKKLTCGNQDKYNSNDLLIQTEFVSSSYVNEITPIYPYDFSIMNDTAAPGDRRTVKFKRSDGINLLEMSASISNTMWNHYAVTKSGSLFSMYRNGTLEQSKTDITGNCINRHCLVYGSVNKDGLAGIDGRLDEIRIYNTALNSSQIQTLATNTSQSFYQTAIMGNVFYKSGNVILSGINPALERILQRDWTLKFKSTHVIYSYECLVRIPAGSFNLSQNPTTLKNPYSDLIIDEMTGSLADGALFPYATTIGLYNDKRELVAIGKLSQALMMRDDVDISISIKFDS